MIKKESSWVLKTSKAYSKLNENIEADVVVVGAGITGIFNAYLLAKAGLKVVVLEKNEQILQGATLATTAFITTPLDSSFPELITLFGEAKAKLTWQSGQDAINLFAEIIQKEKIDCEFQTVSAFTYAQDETQFAALVGESEAIQKAGFVANIQKNGVWIGFNNVGFMEIPGQAKFHPIKFAQTLAEIAESEGVRIFAGSEAMRIKGTTVMTKFGKVSAKDIVIATYAPLTNAGTQFKKGMYVSYVEEIEIPKGLIPEGLFQDMHNPYHYFRIDGGAHFDRMIVGGEDNRQEINVGVEKNFYALEQYVKTVLGNNPYRIMRKWSGPILEPADGLALIGKIKPHTYVATAFSGNGMTYSAISATIIRDLILGKKNVYADLYDPSRISSIRIMMIKARDYIEEFFGGVFKNFFLPKS